PPIRTSPDVAGSRPAVIFSTVVFPDPDGPTSTRNSPSAIRRSSPSTATAPPSNTFRSPRNSISATSAPVPRRDQVTIPERASLGDPLLRRIVDVDQPEALPVPPLPLEVVEQRPNEVAANVDTLGTCIVDRLDVALQVVETPLVVDSVALDMVVEGRAVLGD